MQISKISLLNFNNPSFEGSQKTPLTEADYRRALTYFNREISLLNGKKNNLANFNLDKLNGIQKGIKVFEGLSMKDIDFILNSSSSILLNRGCKNSCAHCAYSATPIKNNSKTLDRISYEDYSALIGGIKTLEFRMQNKVAVCPKLNLFLDSDCIDIEIYDKNGKAYDFVDCLEMANSLKNCAPIFDTTGWNPKNDKLQKRAEKFVDYIVNDNGKNKVSEINISINPYHPLLQKALKSANEGDLKDAEKFENAYAEKMANVLYTFTPLLDKSTKFSSIVRKLPSGLKDSEKETKLLNLVQKKIIKRLRKLYNEDFFGKRKYIKSLSDIDRYISSYRWFIQGSEYDNQIKPYGRAELLFEKNRDTEKIREKKNISRAKRNKTEYFSKCINPNGSVVLLNTDISIPTNLNFNFENQSYDTKPLGSEVSDFHFDYKA